MTWRRGFPLGSGIRCPTQRFWKAAAAGQLATREQVAQQAERMVADPRTRSKLRRVLSAMAEGRSSLPTSPKIPNCILEFNETVASDLRTSLDLFLEDVIGSEAVGFSPASCSADYVYLNGRLARFYGATLPPMHRFRRSIWTGSERAGVLTHPYLMANFAYTATSSPIHRGVFIARSVLGRVLRPPPEAVAPLAADLHPDLTTRQRVSRFRPSPSRASRATA